MGIVFRKAMAPTGVRDCFDFGLKSELNMDRNPLVVFRREGKVMKQKY